MSGEVLTLNPAQSYKMKFCKLCSIIYWKKCRALIAKNDKIVILANSLNFVVRISGYKVIRKKERFTLASAGTVKSFKLNVVLAPSP